MGDSEVVEKLRALVRIPTVSHADESLIDPAPFEEFRRALAEAFPLLHEHLALHRVRDHSLLFRWEGPGDADPLVLMAHIDVVPIDESAPWQHPPFGAEIHDGAIWGRGTLDDKGSLVGICAAVERLLERRLRPGPGRLAVLRCARGDLRRRRRGRGRGAPVTRGDAVVRARRGRRHRARGVPRRRPAARGRRGLREGHHHDRAARRGSRRSLVDPRAGWADRAHRPGRRTTGEAAVRRRTCPSRRWRCSRGSRRTPRSRCARSSPTPAGCSRWSSACCCSRAPSPPPWCVRRWPSPRSPARPPTT